MRSSFAIPGSIGLVVATVLYLGGSCFCPPPTPSTPRAPQSSSLENSADAGIYALPPDHQKALDALCELGYNRYPPLDMQKPCGPVMSNQDSRYGQLFDTFCSSLYKMSEGHQV